MEGLRPLLPDQEYFNIGEASRIVQLPDYTLRYWERKLRWLRPVRRDSGHRRYTKRDLELLLRVRDLVRQRRMTLEGARKVLARELSGRGAAETRTPGAAADSRMLRELKEELRDLISELS